MNTTYYGSPCLKRHHLLGVTGTNKPDKLLTFHSPFNDCRTDRESRCAVRRDENPPVAATMAWPDPDYIRRVIEALRELGDYKGGAGGGEGRSDDTSEIQPGDFH